MARPKTLNDLDKETIQQNFLGDEAPKIDANETVVVAKEIPKYEDVIFVNNRDPGSTLYFHYASKTHPLKHYTLVHGQQYKLPVEIIQHLEGQNDADPYSCHSRLYGLGQNAEGNACPVVNGYKPYFQCRAVRK